MVGTRKRQASTAVDNLRKTGRSFKLPSNRPEPESSQETIEWEVDGVSNINDQGKNSPTITIKGIKWYIRVRSETSDRTQNENNLSVYIYCQEKSKLHVWYADVVASLKLINRRDGTKTRIENFSYRFNHDLTNSGYASFIKMADLLSPAQGFISGNTIKLEAAITVLKVRGLSSAPTLYDFSSPKDNLSNGILVVGGKKLHISKQILAINSPVFEALFFHDFKESKQDEIELQDVDYDEFVELLNVLYTADKEINPTNCSVVLKMADRFGIKSVLKRVEHFICTCYQYPDFSYATRLKLADEYHLYEAQHAVLQKLTKLSDITALKNQRDYIPLSDTMKLLVTDIQLKLQAKDTRLA